MKKKMYYALQDTESEVYKTDDDGNVMYYTDVSGEQSIPVETGETKITFAEPVEFYASLSMSGGDAEAKEYGLSTEAYDATIVCQLGAYPIEEGTLIWRQNEPTYSSDGNIDASSADYTVVKCSESPELVKYILKAVTK